MKNKSVLALVVATFILPTVASAKNVTQSDLIDSTFSVGYKTRDVGSGVNVGVDWQFSDKVGLYGSFNRISGDDTFDTDAQLEYFGVSRPDEELFPRTFSLNMTNVEYGVSFRHVFYDVLETPVSLYLTLGTASLKYDEVEFLNADESNDSSSGNSGDDSSAEPDVDGSAYLQLPDVDAIKGAVGVKFFINNRTTFDVSYSQYKVENRNRNTDTTETSIDVEVSYFPRKNFGLSVMYESADMTGEPTYNLQATVRW